MAHLCVWWTWRSPAVADRLVVHPVQVVPVQVPPVQVLQPLWPKAQGLQDHDQALRQASLVQPLRRTSPWLDRTLA